MTAVSLQKARAVTLRAEFLTVAAVVTAGLSNATTPGLSAPVTPGPGTINMILLIDACLTPAAMVNAVITATEVKTQVLMARGVRTPEGYAATGTSTDTIAVASTGSGIHSGVCRPSDVSRLVDRALCAYGVGRSAGTRGKDIQHALWRRYPSPARPPGPGAGDPPTGAIQLPGWAR